MAKSSTWSNDLLKLLFTNVSAPNIGDASGLQPSAGAGSLYIGLATADPTGGDQTTSEAGYTGYARVAVARSGAGWTVTGATVTNAAVIAFPLCSGGSSTVAYWTVGTASSGAGVLLYSYPLTATVYACTGTTSGNVVFAPGHNFIVNDTIVFSAIGAESLPGGISAGTIYYVKTVSGDSITISTSLGGATLTISADGVAFVGKIATLAVSLNIAPAFGAGAMSITES